MTTPEDDPETREALYLDGLLSPVLEVWRLEYLRQHAPWFDLARKINQTALKLWLKHWRSMEGQKVNSLLPTAARMYGRSINNFAGAVILCERGSAIEAASLARAISESSFWLSYMSKEPHDALHDLEVDELKNTLKRFAELERVSQNDPLTLGFIKDERPKLTAKLGNRKQKRSMDVFAKAFGADTGYLRYRILSGVYSHTSASSLSHHVLITGDDTAFNTLGPHSPEIPRALYFATSALIDGGIAYCSLTGDGALDEDFRVHSMRVLALRDSIHPRDI